MREVVGRGREIFGGDGILLDHDIPRFLPDAAATNTLIVGKSITGQSAFDAPGPCAPGLFASGRGV